MITNSRSSGLLEKLSLFCTIGNVKRICIPMLQCRGWNYIFQNILRGKLCNTYTYQHVNKIWKMISSELTTEIEKDIFSSQTSNALPLSHRESMVSKAHYKIYIWHMSCILLGSAISVVSCFVNRSGTFWAQ